MIKKQNADYMKTAENSEERYGAFISFEPDIIFTGIEMP